MLIICPVANPIRFCSYTISNSLIREIKTTHNFNFQEKNFQSSQSKKLNYYRFPFKSYINAFNRVYKVHKIHSNFLRHDLYTHLPNLKMAPNITRKIGVNNKDSSKMSKISPNM